MWKRPANALAALWGLGEATVFFIVPDVLLSWLALRGLRRALIACLFALSGALAGGTVIWAIGQQDPESTRQLFVLIPGIDSGMIDTVRSQLAAKGLVALFIGPLIGTPYKIYALESATMQLGYLPFLFVSIPARLIRFTIVAYIVAALNNALSSRIDLRHRKALLIAGWVVFYTWYFQFMGVFDLPG